MSLTPPQGLPPEEDPLQLALRLKQGDAAALERVIRTLGPRVAAGLKYRHPALRLEDVEDVLSDASLRLWQARTQYNPAKGSLASWFFIIADNLARDLLRKSGRRAERLMDLDELAGYEAADSNEEPEVPFPRLHELGQILSALPHLDHRIISGYAQAGGAGPWAADLAEELGLRAGTIRVRCRRLKERIRKQLLAGQSVGVGEAC